MVSMARKGKLQTEGILNTEESFTNRKNWDSITLLMNELKSNGPRCKPWGTPDSTGKGREQLPLHVTMRSP